MQLATGDAAAKGFHFLHEGATNVVRTRDPHRLFSGLFAYLSRHVIDEGERPLLDLDVVALAGEEYAVLAPSAIRPVLPALERRLNAAGLRVVDGPVARVDARTMELVVAPPPLSVDRAALAPLGDLFPGVGRRDHAVPIGRYPLRSWALRVGSAGLGQSDARYLTEAVTALRNARELGAQRALTSLATLVAGLRIVPARFESEGDLVRQLAAASR